MRILVRAPIGTTSGYARDGVGLVRALLNRNHHVDVVPTSVLPPLPVEVAELLTYPISNSGYDLEIHHVPPMDAETGEYNKSRSKKVVLWSMWEWDNISSTYPWFERVKENMQRYDQVVAYTQQSLDAFEGAGLIGEGQETSVLQGGFEVGPWRAPYEMPDEVQKLFPYRKFERDTFKFAMLGHLSLRKNPYTVLQAFRELKSEMGNSFDAELIFKSGFPLLPPDFESPGVRFIQEINWSDEQVRAFYWSIDCLINVSWGEGKNLPSMEATMSGTPIILNDIPGHRGWVHPVIQPLVPATAMPMQEGYDGRFTCKDDIKSAMLEVYNNRVASYDRAKQLASYISKRATWDYRIGKFGEEIGVPL